MSEDALVNMKSTLTNQKNFSPEQVKARFTEDFIDFQQQNRALHEPVKLRVVSQKKEEEDDDYEDIEDEDEEDAGDLLGAPPGVAESFEKAVRRHTRRQKRTAQGQYEEEEPVAGPSSAPQGRVVSSSSKQRSRTRTGRDSRGHLLPGYNTTTIRRQRQQQEKNLQTSGSPVQEVVHQALTALSSKDYRPELQSHRRHTRAGASDSTGYAKVFDSSDDDDGGHGAREREDSDSGSRHHSVLGPRARQILHEENPQLAAAAAAARSKGKKTAGQKSTKKKKDQNGGFRWLKNVSRL